MTLDLDILDTVLSGDPDSVWTWLVERVHQVCRGKIDGDVARIIREREHEVGELDDLISTSAWDLWTSFQTAVPRTSEELKLFWQRPHQAKAVLILDGLSLREMPHLVEGAKARGLTVVSDRVTASEIPPETDPFAAALGFTSRSALRGSPTSTFFPDAKTTATDMDWASCAQSITSDPNWIVWHHMPDDRIHALENDGDALGRLSRELADAFSDDVFWTLVRKLTTGRSLVITSDHGYAVGGSFFEMPDGPTDFLRETFKARRSLQGVGDLGASSPPLVLRFDTPRGPYRLALGRRKWKVPGGFPKLTHGGLTLFEVLSPYIEISQ
jgi:hypothetical protein